MGRLVYRLCATFLAALPVDPSGRRVFDETLADWRREQRTGRGMLAVLRALVLAAFAEMRSGALGICALQVFGWSFAWVALSTVVWYYVWGQRGVTLTSMAIGSVSVATFFLPVAVMLAVLRSGAARVPALGLALAGVVVMCALTSWGLPSANQAFFDLNPPRPVANGEASPAQVVGLRAFARDTWPRAPLDYLDDRSVAELVGQVVAGPPAGWGAIQQLSFRLSLVVLCGLMPFAGLALRTQPRAMRIIGTAMLLGAVLYQVRIEALIAPDWIFWMFVSCWVPVVVVALGAAAGVAKAKVQAATCLGGG